MYVVLPQQAIEPGDAELVEYVGPWLWDANVPRELREAMLMDDEDVMNLRMLVWF